MKFLQKRTTPIQNIAYIGIFSAINVVFVLLSSLLPILFLLLVFILPLTSTLVTIYCLKKYYPIYFITSMALCIGVTAGFSVFDSIIYVLPSLITGFIFGIFIEKKVPILYIYLINVFIQFLITSLTFLFIEKCITNVNFYESIYSMIGLSTFGFKGVLTNISTLIIAQIQILITYIFIKYEAKLLELEINLYITKRYVIYILNILVVLLSILGAYYYKDYSLMIALFYLPVMIYQAIELIDKKSMHIYIALGLSLLLFVFVFALLYPYIPVPNSLCLIVIYFAEITIIDILFNYCFKQKIKTIK